MLLLVLLYKAHLLSLRGRSLLLPLEMSVGFFLVDVLRSQKRPSWCSCQSHEHGLVMLRFEAER